MIWKASYFMDLKDLIVVVPELLLLVVPGYISIGIKEKYCLEKKSEIFDITLYSILYSFIIGIVYSAIEALSIHVWARSVDIFKVDTIKQFAYLLLAVFLGLFLVKFPKTTVGVWVGKRFNKNLSLEPSVWIKAMENNSGAWATVYLENGLIYTGMLINYTSDSDDEEKEILLSNYRLSVRNEDAPKVSEDFCTIIVDYTDNSNARVFLKQNVIVAIEIQK